MIVAASVAASPTLWLNTAIGVSVSWSRASTFKRKTGQNPWGMPGWAWGLIGLCFGLLALIPAFIATRRSAVQRALATGQYRPDGWPGSAQLHPPSNVGPQGPGWWQASDGWWYPPPAPGPAPQQHWNN